MLYCTNYQELCFDDNYIKYLELNNDKISIIMIYMLKQREIRCLTGNSFYIIY